VHVVGGMLTHVVARCAAARRAQQQRVAHIKGVHQEDENHIFTAVERQKIELVSTTACINIKRVHQEDEHRVFTVAERAGKGMCQRGVRPAAMCCRKCKGVRRLGGSGSSLAKTQ